MNETANRPGDGEGAHADRLRGDIASGRTGDKVPFPDPAAAPLGTDDEAAGTPPDAARVALARAHEAGGAAGTHAPGEGAPGMTDERARDYAGELKPTRSLMHRHRAISLLAAGAVALSLAMWLLHG